MRHAATDGQAGSACFGSLQHLQGCEGQALKDVGRKEVEIVDIKLSAKYTKQSHKSQPQPWRAQITAPAALLCSNARTIPCHHPVQTSAEARSEQRFSHAAVGSTACTPFGHLPTYRATGLSGLDHVSLSPVGEETSSSRKQRVNTNARKCSIIMISESFLLDGSAPALTAH